MKDSLIRALRTFIQAWLGTFAALAIPFLNRAIDAAGEAEGIVHIDVTLLGNAAIAGVIAGVIALISWAQNGLEEKSGKNILPK